MTPHLALVVAALVQGQGQPRELDFDLGGDRPLAPHFRYAGPDAAKWIKREEAGFRVTLPADRKGGHPIGVRWLGTLKGDFDIIGDFELLSSDVPAKGGGVGVAFNIGPDDSIKKFAKVGRFFREQQSVWVIERWNKDVPGDYRVATTPTDARTGRLRFVRQGAVLSYQAAEGLDGEFRELFRHEFGTEDVAMVRYIVNNTNSATVVDARLLNMKIRSEMIPAAGADPDGAADGAGASGWRRLGALWGVIGAVAILVAGGVGYLVKRRRARQPEHAGRAAGVPAGAPTAPRPRKRAE
ncbi:MAG: DUF1583 domain-containing protein [Gemmataceae bacterium]|nr:DUF1583 domain-containing protein [Gemmataceae bacterium]